MSQRSEISTCALSEAQPITGVGGSTTLWSSSRLTKAAGHAERDVARRAALHVEHVEVLVFVVEILAAVGRRAVAPTEPLLDRLLLPGPGVDRVDVHVALAVEVALQLVGVIARADGPAAAAGHRDVGDFIVGQADQLLLVRPVDRHEVRLAIARLLHFLLRLQARILVVPDHEVRPLVVGLVGSRSRARTATRFRGLALGGGPGATAAGAWPRRDFRQRRDAEDQRIATLGPLRLTVAAHRHAGRERSCRQQDRTWSSSACRCRIR